MLQNIDPKPSDCVKTIKKEKKKKASYHSHITWTQQS